VRLGELVKNYFGRNDDFIRRGATAVAIDAVEAGRIEEE
jgi:hypothetical protein